MQAGESDFRINHLPPYALGSIVRAVNDARLKGRDVIDLSQINPDLGPPSSAIDRLVQASLLSHNHKYSSSQGITKLRESICDWYKDRYGVTLSSEEESVVTMGTKEGLTHLLLAVCNPGDTVLLTTPSYPVHDAGISIAGCHRITIPLFSSFTRAEEVGFRLTEQSEDWFTRAQEVFDATWPRPRCLILNFPHNPTTTTVNQGFFDRLVRFAQERGLLLIHDFSYADIHFEPGSAPSILASPGALDVAVEFFSLSKGFSMPGWRVGFCLGNAKLCSALKKIKSYLDFGLFQPLQVGALQALTRGPEVVKEVSDTYRSRRDVLLEGLRSAGWKVQQPRGTVFVWAGVPAWAERLGSIELSERLLSQCDVAVCPGVGFDTHADGYIRFALGENESRLRKAVERIHSLTPG